MNKYRIVVYFSDRANIECYIYSQLDMKEFTDEIEEIFNTKDNMFVKFGDDGIEYCININNVLFYTIKLVQTGITEEGEQRKTSKCV